MLDSQVELPAVAVMPAVLAFHTGDAPPVVVRYVVDNLLLNR